MVFAAFMSFGSLYHVIGPLCRRLLAAIFVPRILICGLYRFLVLCVCIMLFDVIKVLIGSGSVLFIREYIYLETLKSCISFSLSNFNYLNNGVVCSLYLAPVMILIAFFCLTNNVLIYELWVDPHKVIQ